MILEGINQKMRPCIMVNNGQVGATLAVALAWNQQISNTKSLILHKGNRKGCPYQNRHNLDVAK